MCDRLKADGAEPMVRERTGLVLDAYFSGTKIRWLLDHVRGARAHADRGELAFGTVDSWLLWKLTGGAVHATDVSNASGTLCVNLRAADWDDEMLAVLIDAELVMVAHAHGLSVDAWTPNDEGALRRHHDQSPRSCDPHPSDCAMIRPFAAVALWLEPGSGVWRRSSPGAVTAGDRNRWRRRRSRAQAAAAPSGIRRRCRHRT